MTMSDQPPAPTVPMVLVNVHMYAQFVHCNVFDKRRQKLSSHVDGKGMVKKPIPIDHALQTQMVQNIVSHIELLTKQLSLNLFPILPIENLSNTQEINIDALVLFISLLKFS